MNLHPGLCIDGRYELLESIGQGAQGSVFRVRDKVDGRTDRALKLVPLDQLDAQAFDRARREARTLAKNPHPALIPCHGFFEDIEAGVAGIVMDLVHGQPLSGLLREPRMTDIHRGALLEQLADALAHVHAAEVVHRDLKPDNVLVIPSFWSAPTSPGGIKLLDFGIAADLRSEKPLTMIGGVIGTVPYLSPEHFISLPSAGAYQPSAGFGRDVFAYGVLGAELLLGHHPTGLPTHARPDEFAQFYLDAAAMRKPWPPGRLWGTVGEIVAACLALDPQKRPASGKEIAERFRTPRTELTPIHPMGLGINAPSGNTVILMADPPRPGPAKTEPERDERVSRTSSLIPQPPSAGALPRGAARPDLSPKGVLLGVFAGVVVASALAWVFLSPTGQSDEASERPMELIPAAASIEARLLPDPAPERPAPLCPEPCCGGVECASSQGEPKLSTCASGLTCNPGQCTDILDPGRERLWRLRLANIYRVDGPDMAQNRVPVSGVRVRMRKSGPDSRWLNLPLRAPTDSETAFQVSTHDLVDDGVDIEIRSDEGILGKHLKAKHSQGIQIKALCRGLRFGQIPSMMESDSPVTYEVIVFLDEVKPAP